ncbi:MAG: CsbD family protein [Aquabacterium sp.]|nr:CsbD family protein [Aquabacterium sp.]
MNKDQIKGTLKDAAGKLQQKTGEVTGDPVQQAKGVQKQVAGKTQKAVGDIKHMAQGAGKR